MEGAVQRQEATTWNAAPPKANFESHVPRKMREMQMAMQRVKDIEAGKKVTWRAHREDLPKPQHAKNKRKAEAAASNVRPRYEDDATPADEQGPSKKQKKKQGMDDAAAPTTAAAAQGRALLATKALLAGREPRVAAPEKKVARFGETNAAPPVLQISGRLQKQMLQQRSATQRAEDLQARQREQALKAYHAAKAQKRAEQARSA